MQSTRTVRLWSEPTDSLAELLGRSESRRELLIYYCENCSQLLVASGGRLAESAALRLKGEGCPNCALPLSQTLASRSVLAPVARGFWAHPRLDLRLEPPRVLRPSFVPASSLFGLSSQLPFVDRVLCGLRPDTVALVKGAGLARMVAERYCVRAVLPESLGGLDGRSLFLDGGNSFDVYLYTSIAREYGLQPDYALNRLVISRAFTPYQLLQLVDQDAEKVFENYNPRLLVISDIFGLFTQDYEEEEAARIVRRIGDSVRRISSAHRVPIVITSTTRSEYLEFQFDRYCSVKAEFTDSGRVIRSRLFRHPSRQPFELVQEVSGRAYNQGLLSPLGVTENG